MDQPQWTWRKNLVGLIQSLSASEKRYVTLHLQALTSIPKQRSSKYIAAMKSAEKAEKFSLVDSNYLWERILHYLKVYQTASSIDLQLAEMRQNANLLLERRLYVESKEQLDKAIVFAERFDRLLVLIDLLLLKESVLLAHSQTGMIASLKANQERIAFAVEQNNRFVRAEQFRNFSFLGLRQYYTKDETQAIATIRESMSIEIEEGDCLIIRHHLLMGKAALAIRNKEFAKARDHYAKLIQDWEKYPERIADDGIEFNKLLSNYVSTSHSSGDFVSMLSGIHRIEKLVCKTAEEEAEQFQNVFFMKLLHLMNTDGFDNLNTLVEEIETGLVRYKTKVNKAREIAFCHNIGMSYFLLNDWKKALHWIERIIKQEKTEHRQDLQHTARMLRLVLWYELNKHDLLEYELINVERFLRKRKAWFAYESTVVKFFGKLLLADGVEKKKLMQKFNDQLVLAVEGKTSAGLPGSSELTYWAKSYLSGETMRNLLLKDIR